MSTSSKCIPFSANGAPVTDLSYLYDQLDPRAYYKILRALEYKTPRHIQKLAAKFYARHQKIGKVLNPWILDVGCGYATNAAGLQHNIDPLDLYSRYDDPSLMNASSEDLFVIDRNYFSNLKTNNIPIAGLEIATNALRYGTKTGLLKRAFGDDLTHSLPSTELLEVINKTSVIIESGVPVYVFPYIIDSILSSCVPANKPKIITAPPRYADISVYEEVFEKHGYILEQAQSESLVHRRFISEEEKKNVLNAQTASGLNNEKEETEECIHVVLYMARHKNDPISL